MTGMISARIVCHFRTVLGVALSLAMTAAAWTANAGEEPGTAINSLTDLNGKRLGVIVGTMLDNAANDYLDLTQIEYYDDTNATIAALYAGEIDAIIDDQPVARYLASVNPRLRRLPGVLMEDNYGYALRLEDEELYAEVNKTLKEIMADGTLKDMESRWLDGPDENCRVMPDLPPQRTGRVLRLGVSPVSAPFTFSGPNGATIGLDVELMERLARRINRRLVVVTMEFSNLIPSLLRGEVDIIGSCLSITPERERIVRFTESYYQGGVAALVLNK